MAFATLLAVTCWILADIPQPLDPNFIESHVLELAMQSSRLQMLAYVLLLTAVGLASVYFAQAKPRPHTPVQEPPWVLLFAVFGAIVFLLGDPGIWFWRGFFLTLVATAVAAARGWLTSRLTTWICRLLVVAAGVYLLVLVLLPFFTPMFMADAAYMVSVSTHYAVTVLPGADFVCCGETGSIQRSNYGLGMMLLTALGYKLAAGGATSQLETLFAVIRGYQVVAIGLALCLAWMVNRKSFLLLAAMIVLTTATLDTIGPGSYFPNQAGVRYIPFLAGLFVLAAATRRERTPVWMLAAFSGLMMVLSPEIGIALAVGSLTLHVLQNWRHDKPVLFLAANMAGFFALTAMAFVGLTLAAVRIFYADAVADTFTFVKLFSSGYGGLVGELSAFGAMLVLFGSAAVMRAFQRAGAGRATSVSNWQGALGAVILAWMPYYMNRMAEWNLWFQAILLVLLIGPQMHTRAGRLLGGSLMRLRSLLVLTCIALFGGLGLAAAERVYSDLRIYAELHRAGCTIRPALVQPACHANPGLRSAIVDLQQLAAVRDKDDYLVLSVLPAQVRLLGFNEDFPWYDAFGEIIRQSDMGEAATWIRKHGARFIVIDNPASVAARSVPNRTRHLRTLVAQLPEYRQVATTPGWITYERVGASR
jgi:hypothetical protein